MIRSLTWPMMFLNCENPEVLLFVDPDRDEELQFVGVEYVQPIAYMDNLKSATKGFTGSFDV